MNIPITFDTTDCPTHMASAGILPLVASPTISNVRIRHVLIDSRSGLNIMSLHAFKALQIPMSKLTPSHPFGGVGNDPV
jgi:hypothetical protein